MEAKPKTVDSGEITEKVIGCAYKVSNRLGCGFLEKVYKNAMIHEIKKAGLKVESEFPITIRYDGEPIGEYFADLLVDGHLLVELKAVEGLDKIYFASA